MKMFLTRLGFNPKMVAGPVRRQRSTLLRDSKSGLVVAGDPQGSKTSGFVRFGGVRRGPATVWSSGIVAAYGEHAERENGASSLT